MVYFREHCTCNLPFGTYFKLIVLALVSPQIFDFFNDCLAFTFTKHAGNNWEMPKRLVVLLDGEMSFIK